MDDDPVSSPFEMSAPASAEGISQGHREYMLEWIDEWTEVVLHRVSHVRLLEALAACKCQESQEREVVPALHGLSKLLVRLHELRAATASGELDPDGFGAGLAGLFEVIPESIAESGMEAGVFEPPSLISISLPSPPGGGGAPPGPGPPWNGTHSADEIQELLRNLQRLLDWLKGLSRTIVGDIEGGRLGALIEELERLMQGVRTGGVHLRHLLLRFKDVLLEIFRWLWLRSRLPGPNREPFRRALLTLRRLIPMLGRLGRYFVFLGTFLNVLFAAEAGWAAGSAIAQIKVNDRETVGTWWGSRFWDLMKGPCPDLLDALSQAILRWRQLHGTGAPGGEVNDALGLVLLLESEYIRRCLPAGSAQATGEQSYLNALEDQYRREVEREHGLQPHPTEKCRATIQLARVSYEGSDVGHKWRYEVTANGATASFATHDLTPGGVETPNRTVFSGEVGPCGGIGVVTISVEARSVGTFTDSVGNRGKVFQIQCPGRRTDEVVVWVTYGDAAGYLRFTFDVEGICGPMP